MAHNVVALIHGLSVTCQKKRMLLSSNVSLSSDELKDNSCSFRPMLLTCIVSVLRRLTFMTDRHATCIYCTPAIPNISHIVVQRHKNPLKMVTIY